MPQVSGAITESIDVAQVALYVFWAFFFGLVFWLRREDRREGYPLETDGLEPTLLPINPVLIPTPKTFILPHGGEVESPNFARDTRERLSERTRNAAGSPYQPVGDPMLSGVGPASFTQRSDHPEAMREGGDLIVPMRVASDFSVSAGPDPRGFTVLAANGAKAGVVHDLWVDRADSMIRYVEVKLLSADGSANEVRLVPMTMARVHGSKGSIEVTAITAEHFAKVPTLKDPNRITVNEEERISAFYAGGRLYAEPGRLGPVV